MEFCTTSHFWEVTTAKGMKIDPYYQRQNVAMTLVSGNIRCVQIFAGVPLGGSVKWQWGFRLSTTVISGNLGGYFFGNVRDKASNITWRYATLCWPEIDCRM